MTWLLAICISVALLHSAGCVHPCLALAEEICECEETESDRMACKRQARSLFDQAPKADTQEAKATCSALLDECDCAYIATEAGKQACGLSLPPNSE